MKHDSHITSTDAGIRIDCNDKQPENALASIRVNCEGDSNANLESDSQPEKQSGPIVSTVAGIQPECNDEHPENALGPICCNLQHDSKITEESDLQS
jgi:hypothetical protein